MLDAKEKIKEQLDVMFAAAPRSRAAWELQEELLANCLERYEDLVKDGMEPQQALNNVMGSIGNVDELIAALPMEDYGAEEVKTALQRQRSALIVTVSVGLYILAGVVFFLGVFLSAVAWEPAILLGLALAAVVCIVPTCMLVYNAYRYPRYKKSDDTVVENFKEWNSDSQKMSSVRKAITSLIWTLTVVIYLLVSFLTFAWYITWIIFLVAACLEAVVTLVFRLKELR